MKPKILYLLGLSVLMACSNDSDLQSNDPYSHPELKGGVGKVAVCHYDSDMDEYKTLNIAQPAVQAHLNHGDFLGECEADSDGDGVFDYLDQCPDTPIGVEVDEYGCPINLRPFIFSFRAGYSYIYSWTVSGVGLFTVDWGDGHVDADVTGSITHTYDPNDLRISITVAITSTSHISPFAGSGRFNTYTIHQWGDIKWTTLANFLRFEHVDMLATDVPDLSNCTSLANMFSNTYGEMNNSIGNWDVSSITDMSGMFRGRPVPADLSNWDVSSVMNMEEMFEGDWVNIGLEPDFIYGDPGSGLSGWDVSNVTNMARMFQDSWFNQDISGWNVSNVVNMTSMFERAILFNQDLSSWDVGEVFLCVNFSNNTPEWILPKPIFPICTP